MIRLNDVAVNYSGRVIFSGLSWTINTRDRVGLVGPNGAGKSSLLRLIAGEMIPDAGQIDRGRLSVGYLPQQVELEDGRTLIEAAMVMPPELADLESQLNRVEEQLGDPVVYNDEAKLARVLDRQERLLENFDRLDGHRHGSLVKELLAHLGFSPDDYDLPCEVLSGGQKKLVALIRLAVGKPDVLLLDEPDNHLDLHAKRCLESFIRAYEGAVVIVSHDRYLLDEVVTQIAELENGRLTLYVGSYSAYATEREHRLLRQQQQYVTQQKEIARIEASIARFEEWASRVVDERHIRQARSRRKMLERMEANGEIIEAVRERRRMGLELNGWRGSNEVLKVDGVSMGFDGDLLFVDLNFLIRHGERVGMIAPNGAGKSVLFRLILGELAPLEGQIKIGPSVKVGYYAQEHQTLAEWMDRTPLDLVRYSYPRSEGDAIAFLTKFLFSYDQATQPIGSLSGGERSRLQLACLMLERPNLLLLDEPTNNLDIPSAEVLEETLATFEGSIFVISHDRYFLDRVVDRVLVLEDGELDRYEGGYSDYLEAVG